MPIINGRMVNIPDAGVYGSELIKEANPDPLRRVVAQKRGGFESIDSNKKYTRRDLVDRQGRPVKIVTIPERSKGNGTPHFGGHRNQLSKQLITEQVFDVAEHLFKDGVDFDEDDANWFVVPNFVLPRVWWNIAKTTPLMICFPTEYPAIPPIGFYLKADIPQSPNGLHFFETAYHDAWKEPLDHDWKWYCAYVQPGAWRPAAVRREGDWKRGDNLWTYLTLVNEVLASHE